jgi:CheY-like chemotaxis protein
VLDLSKVESGKMEFRPERVDIAGLVGEVRDILRTLSAQKRIRVDMEIDPTISGITLDPAKLKQILYNYLSNALKFTPDEGKVAIRVMAEDLERFRLEVEDTGIGIRPDDMDKLFTEFQQLDASTAKKYPGTGLGLALTKRIVEAQGGHVGARSVPGKGSVFFGVLPRVAEPVGEVDVEPLPTRPGAPKILVVEDDVKDRAWLVRTLTDAGYTVELAETGKDAVGKCRSETFDAITLDLMLPDISGRDVLAAVRADSLNVNTPVIVVSVVADSNIGVGVEVRDILLKPVQSDHLLESLQRARVAANVARPILVVDDDPQALKVAERTLKQLGYRPVCRSDGEGGLQAAEQERPAAVILDLLMPEMDGFEFLKRFRRTKGGRQTPVIVWTAKDLSRQERDRLKASARAIVMKSKGATALVEELQSCVASPAAATHAEDARRAR